MAITTYDGLLETWTEEIETIEQNLETLYGPATITPVLPSVTTEDGMFEAVAEGTEITAWNFAKKYNYLTTESNATRIVDVPDTALYYGQFVKIGGHTIVESDELLSAEVTKVVSKNATGNTLQTYTIPAEIQALEGYGWSAGSVYNYVDFERKVFVKNVGSVDFGTLNWTRSTSYTHPFFYTSLSDRKTGRNDNYITAEYSNDYEHYTSNSFGDNANNMSITLGGLSGNSQVFVRNDSYADAPTFKTAMSGVYIYYELATPIETDISAYITDTDIKVVPGGTLTFDNSNDIDAPSEVKYIS